MIALAGVVGIVLAGYAFAALTRRAVRDGRYLDLLLAMVVAAAVIVLLLRHGDRLLQ